MKRTLLIILLLSIGSANYSQNYYQYVFHEPHGVVNAIDINKDSFLVAAGSTESCPEGFVAYFNSKGTLFWRKTLNEYLSPATDVFFDREDNIIAAGTKSLADDIGFPNDGIYLLKLDFNGNIIFYKRFRRGSYLSERVHALQLPDSNYLIGVLNILFWASPNGDSLQTKELPIDRILDITVISDSTVLVLSKNKAIIINSKGDIINDIPTQEDFIATCNKNDTTWILGTQNLWEFKNIDAIPQLYSLQNITLPQGITPKRDASGIIIWGKNGADFMLLNFINGIWSSPDVDAIVGTRVLDIKNIRKKSYFAGSDLWEDMPQGNAMHGAFVSASTEGYYRTAEITSDIGILNVTTQLLSPLDTSDKIIRADTLVAFLVSGQFEASIKVVNQSVHKVDKFVLSSSRQGGFNCAEGRAFYAIIDSIDIDPNETKTIKIRFSDFTRFFTYISIPNILQRCFFVAAPNHLFDEYRDNNSFCVSLLTSTKNIKQLNHVINIFPNPASGIIQIQTENDIQIESLHLFNITGHLQNIAFSINFNQATLHRNHLPAGLYWLKIQTKEGFTMKKIIFQ